jgi:hypothetical protein
MRQATSARLERVSADLCCPFDATPSGSKYMSLHGDEQTRFRYVTFLKSKSEVAADTTRVLNLLASQLCLSVKQYQTDGAAEYESVMLKSYYNSKGVQHRVTVRHTPEQNGVTERQNWAIVDKVRAALNSANLDPSFWADAALDAVDKLSHFASRATGNVPQV